MRRLRTSVIIALLVTVTGCSSSGNGTGTVTPTTGTSGSSSASTRDVSFDADGTTTYGTLETPAHRSGQRLAAALLIPGSGPTDRDGNDTKLGLTAATLRLVADRLAAQGVMTLRYDKYFAGKTGAGQYADKPQSITITAFFDQADAAYDFLAKQSDADPAKLLVVGHSEGGMVALHVAGAVSQKPAGLALLEPQDQRILTLIEIQVDEGINQLVAKGTLTDDQARSDAAILARAISNFRAGTAIDLTGLSASVRPLVAGYLTGPNAGFLRSNDAVVPAQLAQGVKAGTRVLVTVGTRDTNVPPRTITPLMTALNSAGVTGPKLTVLRGLDHLLHTAEQPDSDAVLAPAAASALQGWAAPYAA